MLTAAKAKTGQILRHAPPSDVSTKGGTRAKNGQPAVETPTATNENVVALLERAAALVVATKSGDSLFAALRALDAVVVEDRENNANHVDNALVAVLRALLVRIVNASSGQPWTAFLAATLAQFHSHTLLNPSRSFLEFVLSRKPTPESPTPAATTASTQQLADASLDPILGSEEILAIQNTMNSRLDAMLTLNSIPGNQQQQTQSIPASEEPSHINLLSGMHDWSVISPIRTMNSLTGVQGNISSVSEIRPRQRPIIPPVNLSFHRNPHLDGTMIAGPTDGPFVVVGDDYDDNSVLQRSQLPHNYSNQKASHEVFDSYESINPVSLEPLPQGFYTVVRSSEQFLELLRKTFVGWYLVTQQARNKKSHLIENWMQAVHMWRNNTLKSAFHRWIDKERDRKLAKKRKAFNALYAFVLHPKAEALAMHRYTSLRHNFVSWFRAAYKRRSWKRRLELAVDIAVDFDRNRLTVAMFQLWKHRFVRNGLLQSASQKATKALDLSLKRRVFKLWFKKRRLNETSTQIYSRTILRGFFKAWKGRKRILLLYRKGDIHGTFLRNELVLLCFQLWKERTKTTRMDRFRIQQKYFESWVSWTIDHQAIQYRGQLIASRRDSTLMVECFVKWFASAVRERDFKMKLEAFRVPRLKKNFLQWIRYTKYMICVARKKDMISSRCFLISKMLFFEAGAQIHNVDELDGLCDIASDMIQSSIKERLIATFAAWRERFSYWRRRMMLAQLRERDLYVKRRFRKWKQQAVGCLNRIKTVAKKSDDILLERMFERWKARRAEKVTIGRVLRQEDLISRHISGFKRSFFQTWLNAARLKRKLRELTIYVTDKTVQNIKRRLYMRWKNLFRKTSWKLLLVKKQNDSAHTLELFQRWRISFMIIRETYALSDSLFRKRIWRTWRALYLKAFALRQRFEVQLNVKMYATQRFAFRKWRRRLKTRRLEICGVMLWESKITSLVVKCFRQWSHNHRNSKLVKFERHRLLHGSWVMWKERITENTRNILATQLYQQWITVLAFRRWIAVFQSRMRVDITVINRFGVSLREIPAEMYPTYVVEPIDASALPMGDPLVLYLFSIRVSGWTVRPANVPRALDQHRTSSLSLRLSFGTICEPRSQTELRSSFTGWKCFARKKRQNENFADSYVSFSRQNATFRIWRAKFLKKMRLRGFELLIIEKFRFALLRMHFLFWKRATAAVHLRELRVAQTRSEWLLRLALHSWRRSFNMLRISALVLMQRNQSQLKVMFAYWKSATIQTIKEAQANAIAILHWRQSSCRRVLRLLLTVVVKRQTAVTVSAILFLNFKKRMYIRKWRTQTLLHRIHERNERTAVTHSVVSVLRNSFISWRIKTIRRCRFAVIELKLENRERAHLQMKYFRDWTRELTLQIAAARVHRDMLDGRMKRTFSIWRYQFEVSRKGKRVEIGVVKLVGFFDKYKLQSGFEAFRTTVQMCRKLDVLYQSWIRQRATRVIPIPRLTRSISQLLDLLTLQKFFSKWSLLNVMQQLAIQHGNLKLMGRMTFLWLSRLGYNFENQKTAEQFNKNRIQVRQWDVWTIQLDIRKDCRQRLEVKRKILMSWHHWAETESSIRRFVLLHSFKKWKEKLNLRDRSRKLIKKADKMRKIHLFQTFFYQWWRTANLRISQNADAMRSDTDIRQFMSASQLSSTGWLPSLMQYNESQPLMQDNSTTMHASWLGKRIMSAEDFMNLEETADVFRLSKLQHNAWIKLKTLNKSRMFERQRKLIFAEGWARKMLKKKVLIAWSKVLR